VTYYESNRPRQYYPDFIVETEQVNGTVTWLAETKGEMRTNTLLKAEAAKAWCEKMSRTSYGEWRYLFIPQKKLESALASGIETVSQLADWLLGQPQLGRLEQITN
jgi:hypothetical protein